MADTVKLVTFPSNKEEALTMLFLESQDLKNLSEHDFIAKYYEVRANIKRELSEQRPRGMWG